MKKMYFIAPVLLLAVFLGLTPACSKILGELSQVQKFDFNALRIAHAGGGINGLTYTNSIEALDENFSKGFVYFEIDFMFTTDGRLVCIHDWEHTLKKVFGLDGGAVTFDEFNDLVADKTNFHPCTEETLADWMSANPEAYIISDTKEEDNLAVVEGLSKVLPSAALRVIPQIYRPENYEAVKNVGFEQIIWTLYKYKGTNDEILTWLTDFRGSLAITMPPNRAKTGLASLLKERSVPTYVHTINDNDDVQYYFGELDITEIYTDFLPPRD